jgi:hypothetical protein
MSARYTYLERAWHLSTVYSGPFYLVPSQFTTLFDLPLSEIHLSLS